MYNLPYLPRRVRCPGHPPAAHAIPGHYQPAMVELRCGSRAPGGHVNRTQLHNQLPAVHVVEKRSAESQQDQNPVDHLQRAQTHVHQQRLLRQVGTYMYVYVYLFVYVYVCVCMYTTSI